VDFISNTHLQRDIPSGPTDGPPPGP
jgi:hypothetical protein